MRYIEVRRHTMRVKPGHHLSQPGFELARRLGQTIGPFDRVITSTIHRAYQTACAMGFPVDEQNFVLNIVLEGVQDEVAWDAGFAAFAQAVQRDGAAARLAQKQQAYWRSVAETLTEGASALLITHGGIIEAGAVACLPAEDHNQWGAYIDYCEGVRLAFDGANFIEAKILRVNHDDD